MSSMGKRQESGCRRWLSRLRGVSHLFSKIVVGWCILSATGFSLYAMRILSRTGHDPAGLLGVVLAFFGGELLALCLKQIMKEQ